MGVLNGTKAVYAYFWRRQTLIRYYQPMKQRLLFFAILFLTKAGYSQLNTKYRIDTLQLRYTIPGVVNLFSVAPQLEGEINGQVKEAVNRDLRNHFMAALHEDSAAYVQKLMTEYNVKDLEGYRNLMAESGPDEFSEDYRLPYTSDELLSFTYASTLYPAGGRPQFTFESKTYDLKTGDAVTFNELLSIEPGQFKDVFQKKGYYMEELSIPDTPFVKVPVSVGMEDMDEFMKSLYAIEDAGCVAYYLEKTDSGLHLMFNYQCNGPAMFTFGIDLNELKPWLEHPALRNMYRSWGDNIFSLKGTILPVKTDSICFGEYTIRNGGGYTITSGDTTNKNKHFISYWNAADAAYYIFERGVSKAENRKRMVLDVLEIKKSELAGDGIVVEGCETATGRDAELMALVKKQKGNPEYYTKIIKAWRANRVSGKFEPVERTKIKRCANESDGI